LKTELLKQVAGPRPEKPAQTMGNGFKDAVKRNPHLREYLERAVRELGLGTPQFVPTLSREMRSIGRPNLIYPVGDPIFIHICTDKSNSIRKMYKVIEPRLPQKRANIFEKIESKIVARIDERIEAESQDEKLKILMELLDEVCQVKDSDIEDEYKEEKEKRGVFSRLSFVGGGPGKLSLKREEYEVVKYYLYKNRVGLGILEPLIRDPYIEDISCDGVGPIFVEHKTFQSLMCDIGFESRDELDRFALWLSERCGKQATNRNPIVDTILSDGSRLNLVYGEDVSMKGTNFTIRKFSAEPISVPRLISFGTMDPTLSAYLWMLLREGMNIFVCGETASGKTTTLTAITCFIKSTSKIVSIEDTPEVQLPQENWIREMTRPSQRDESSIGMFELLKSALRQRPNYIIVGEIRGVEGNIAFQAMMTGHPVLSTFHSSSVPKTVQRLTGHPILVPKTHVTNLNAILIQNAVYDASGQMKRRITSLNELVSYNPTSDSFSFIEAFRWIPGEDKYVFRAEGNSYLLEEKIGRKRGYSEREISVVYDELRERSSFLKRLTDEKTYDYREFYKRVIEADKQLTKVKA
jgi:flagellar protein FlaI